MDLQNEKQYQSKIDKLVNEYVYNLGNSAEVGGKYLVDAIKNKIAHKKGGNE